MDNSSIAAIKHIKRKLELNEMSVLVGAGFSKNIDEKAFLSWWELLKPMVIFLFEDEIELAFNSILLSNKKVSKTDFVNNRVEYYIKKIGYTQLVTLYAKRKGNLESITAYVEEHTPWIKTNSDGEKELVIGQSAKQIKKLTAEMLSQHELLVSLDWNNIYTTNYDNALECVLDKEGRASIEEKYKQTSKEIEKLESRVVAAESDHARLESELQKLEQTYRHDNDGIQEEHDDNIQEEYNDIRKKRNEVFTKKIVVNSLKSELEKNQQNFFLLENAIHDIINVVTKSSELSIKRNRNIIKLHGNLRHLTEYKQYGFDGDNRNQYIFSEESYKQYPLKHEAFTNLMRISLLQESFLLIGFSGADPNFTEWIKWVRDVIEVKGDENKDRITNSKIYLIDLDNSPLREDLELYYENHNIFCIKLMDERVVSFLEQNQPDKRKTEKTYTDVINLFLRYLSNGINYLSVKLALSQFESNTITALVKKIVYSNRGEENVKDLFLNLAKGFKEKKDGIKYMKLHATETFIKSLHRLYEENFKQSSNKLDDETRKLLFRSTCLIIDILNIPICEIFTEDEQQAIEQQIEATHDQNIIETFAILKEKQLVFQGRLSDVYISNIHKAYCLMYQLNIYDLLRFTAKWRPHDVEELFTKLSIQYLFNQIHSQGYLSFEYRFQKESPNVYHKYLKLAEIILNKELIYSGVCDEPHKRYLKKSISIKIKYLENNGVISGKQILENYMERFTPRQNVEKYGKDRFSTSKTVYLGDTPEQGEILAATQYLYSLPEYVSSLYINDIESIKWYEMTKILLVKYPFPIIFYSLCKGDKKILHRLSKDLCFVKEKELILKSLMHAFHSDHLSGENYEFEVKIIILISQMLHCVDTKIWNHFFVRFWESHKDIIMASSFRCSEYTDFICIGIQYTSEVEMVVLEILAKLKDASYEDGYNILSKLFNNINNNVNFKKSLTINRVFQEILSDENINKKWVISSSLFGKLTKDSKMKLETLVEDVDLEKNMSDSHFSDIIYRFSNKNKKLRDKLNDIVFTPQRLWDTGYSKIEGGGFGRNDPESLFFLEYFRVQLNILIKRKSIKIKLLFDSLDTTYDLMKKLSDHTFPFDDFDTQIRNIIFFLNVLRETPQNNIPLEDVKLRLDNFKNIATIAISKDDIKRMLSSMEKEDFNKALEGIDYEIIRIKRDVAYFQFEINLIFGRLFSCNDVFESALGYLTRWVFKKRGFIPLFKEQLSLIIETYSNLETYPDELDKMYVIQHLTIIAIVLQDELSNKNEIIDSFLNQSAELNFNIINKAIADAKHQSKKFVRNW